jgi:cell pole-organizing protein PopZ
MGEAAPKDSSMEDILASIRRIITSDGEKNDRKLQRPVTSEQSPETVRGNASVAGSPGQSPSTPSKPNAPALSDKPRMNDSGTDTAQPSVGNAIAEKASAVPGSLADLANRMREAEGTPARSQVSFASPDSAGLRPTITDPEQGRSAMSAAKPEVKTIEEKTSEPAATAASRNLDTAGAPALPSGASGSFSKFASQVLSGQGEVSMPVAAAHKPATPGVEEQASSAETEAKAAVVSNPQESNTAPSLVDEAEPEQETAQQPAQAEIASPAESDIVAEMPLQVPEMKEAGERSVDPIISGGIAPQGNRDDIVGSFREALVSPATQYAVSGSMNRLKKSVSDQQAALAEATLRPMLKEWLDSNLPAMVEKMVREEIDRISGSIEDSAASGS